MPIFDYSHQLFDHLIHFTLHNGHPPSPLFHLPPRFLMFIFPSILLQKRIPFRVAQPNVGVTEQGDRVELVSKELFHLAAILHVYAGSLIFIK